MPKRIVDEEMRFKIIINGNEAQKELYDLEKSTRELTARNKELRAEKTRLRNEGKRESEQYKALTKEISQNSLKITENKRRMEALQKEIGITGLSMSQLKQRATILNLTLSKMVPGSAKYKQYQKELAAINARLRELRTGANATKISLGSIANGFNKYAALGASVIATLTGVVFSVQKMIDYNGKLSDSMSDVRKTTGLTKTEVEDLAKGFGTFKTRTARIELLELAEEAGRLGIEGVENIKDFVQVANQMKVALGDDLSTVQIREVGKMVNIYEVGTKTGRDFKNSMLSLGSAINEVAASGANQAGFLVEYLKRQAGVAAQTRLSAQDNIGYAATFDELGQSVEVSATAMNKIWLDMFNNSEAYAKIAGMNVKEFTQLLNTDANAAMIAFLKGLNNNSEGLDIMTQKLEDLEVGGTRGVQALLSLAGNTELLEKRQKIANQALNEATSLTDEYNLKNNNLGATLDKIKKKLIDTFTSQSVQSGLGKIATWFAKLIGVIDDSTKALKEERIELLLLDSKIKDVNTTQEQRIGLIKKFQERYPGYLQNLDAEKVTNEQLSGAIEKVNEQLINKIILQEKDSEIEEQLQKTAELKIRLFNQEEDVRIRTVKLADKNNIKLKEGLSFQEQAKQIIKELGISAGVAVDPVAQLSHELNEYKILEENLNRELEKSNDLSARRDELAKRLNITLRDRPSQGPGGDSEPKEGDTKIIEGQLFKFVGGKWIPFKITGSGGEDKKKIDEAKKIADQLNKLERETIDARIALMKDGFEKEIALENENHKRKLEDLEAQKISEEKIKAADASGNKNLADSYRKINAEINQQVLYEKQQHLLRLGILEEQAATDSVKKLEDQYKREKTLRQTDFNDQLAKLKTLEEAKLLLKDSLSKKELAKIKTLDQAKSALQEEFNKKEIEKEKAFLQLMVALLEDAVNGIGPMNISLLTPEQIEELKKQAEKLKLILSELNLDKNNPSTKEERNEGLEGSELGKTDILGFTVAQWDSTFAYLDKTQGKLERMGMAIQSLQNLWGMYDQFVTDNENRRLQQYEESTERQKEALKRQLDSGQISQERYNQRVSQLDKNLDKEKKKIEYEQAKRQRLMAISNVLSNTALAIMSIWAQVPKFDFGISAGILTGIVSAIGALQLATILKQPLPSKGYEKGLYPIKRTQDGALFDAEYGGSATSGVFSKPTFFAVAENKKPEMVIDNDAFKQMNPDVRNSMIREVARVKGYQTGLYSETVSKPEYTQSSTSALDGSLIVALNRNSEILEKLDKEGLIAFVSSVDMSSMKNLKQGIDDYNKLRDKNKI